MFIVNFMITLNNTGWIKTLLKLLNPVQNNKTQHWLWNTSQMKHQL